MEFDQIGKQIVDSALQVHRAIGPGLLESAYEACLSHELNERGLTVARQAILPVRYKSVTVDQGYLWISW